MLHQFTWAVLLGVIINLDGCMISTGDEPKLTKQEREIVQRRKRHGKETTFDRPSEDGRYWRYDSKDDDWKHVRDPFPTLP